jgi:ADP-ribose pyrophosphatase YjhB (NUDIX family)
MEKYSQTHDFEVVPAGWRVEDGESLAEAATKRSQEETGGRGLTLSLASTHASVACGTMSAVLFAEDRCG